jgi:hypothetical protein
VVHRVGHLSHRTQGGQSRQKPRRVKQEVARRARETPSWSRSWANFSLLQLYSHRNSRANLHLLGQPNSFLASGQNHPQEGAHTTRCAGNFLCLRASPL